jgi:hypothetical protein
MVAMEIWRNNCEKLKAHLTKHNQVYPKRSNPEHEAMACWVQVQRRKYKDEDLPPLRVDELNQMKFVWEEKQPEWDAKLRRWIELQNSDHPDPAEIKRVNAWAKKQRERETTWEKGNTTHGTVRKRKTKGDEEHLRKRKLLSDAGFEFQRSFAAPPNESAMKEHVSLLPTEYSATNSHSACLEQLRNEFKKTAVGEPKKTKDHFEKLVKDYDQNMQGRDEKEFVNYEKWKQENGSMDTGDQTEEEDGYWTGKQKPDMPQKWPPGFKFDTGTRVLTVDFHIVEKKHGDYPELFWLCLERDDIAVVSEGLLELTPELWTLEHATKVMPEEHQHGSIQKFSKGKEHGSMTEKNIPMTLCEYQKEVKENGAKIYLSDYPLDYLPRSKSEFTKGMEKMMPGGPNCLLRDVSENLRCPLVTITFCVVSHFANPAARTMSTKTWPISLSHTAGNLHPTPPGWQWNRRLAALLPQRVQ